MILLLSLLAFGISLALLLCEGKLLTIWIMKSKDRTQWLWALPLAAVSNVFVIFLFTITGIPLVDSTLWGAHVIICIALWIWLRKKWPSGTIVQSFDHPAIQPSNHPTFQKILITLCSLLLVNAFLFSVVHSVLLPSQSIDVFTNWTMRAKVSWSDGHIAFDKTEARGIAKPQYPFLVHGLQIMANSGQLQWSDHIANTITWLLTVSSFGAAFLLMKRMRGTLVALGTLSATVLIPMMTIQLAAGYGDIHLVTYGLLAFLTLAMFMESQEKRWLLVSSVMVTGALWSKSEGLYFLFVPWAMGLGMMWLRDPSHPQRGALVKSLMIPVLCFAPFLIMLIMKGLPLTPHESDGSFGVKWEGFAILPKALFGGGSFGILWYVLPASVAAIVIDQRKTLALRPWLFALLMIGLISLAGVFFIYLFTPNVGFLLNGQSFYRQMLLPAALLIAWCGLAMRRA